MYTSYIGINVQNAGKAFYRDSLSSDRARIHALFANAKDRQIRIAPLILDLDDARRFLLSSRYAIVMLVNLALLNCKSCKKERQRNTILRPWWWLLRRKYFGRKLPPVDEKYSLIDPLMRRSSLDSVASSLSLKSSDTATAPTSVPSIMACVTAISASPVGAVTSQTSIRSPPSSSSSYFAPSSPSPLVTQTKKKNSSVCSFLTCCYPRSSTPTQDEFTGHYILLVGYDLDTDTFYYRDPGTTTSLCSVRGKSLERARNSPGTDHDAIVIKMR